MVNDKTMHNVTITETNFLSVINKTDL